MTRTTTESDYTGADFLETVELFAALSPALRERLLPAFELVRVPAGSWVCRQGEPGEALLVVQSGRLEVVVDSASGGRRAGLLGPGSVLGELALLLGGVRSASVRALRETELLRLERQTFDELLRDVPAFAVAVARALARQLERRVPESVAATRETAVVAVVGLTPGVGAVELTEALLRELGGYGTATLVPPAEPGFDEAEVGRALGRLEAAHDIVLLLAPSWGDAEGWARFCLRQADSVIGVVDPRTPPPPGLDSDLAGCQVVFTTSYPVEGRRLRAWLNALRPAAHHLVGAGSTRGEDVARLARRLTGHSLGVVLSGGGARGLAHIGVLKALVEAGYTIDRVGGTSMGSLVASLFAIGRSPAEIEAICHAELVVRNPFNDYTLPRYGLIRARKATGMLTRLFGDATVETTRRSLFTVSADLVTGQEVVHRQGLIVAAVGASMSIPGVAPPVRDGSRLLVDGGVLNNLPVDVMAEGQEGPIVAVDVRQLTGPTQTVGPLALPSMVETLGRACVLGSWRKTDRTRLLASVVVAPDLPGVGLFDYKQYRRIIAEGRRAAELALATTGLDLPVVQR